MQSFASRGSHPRLKELLGEASRALARLDADRLEELALSCQALNRDLEPAESAAWTDMAHQAREARADMALFARVLDATRSNLAVMRRLRELRAGRHPGYAPRDARAEGGYGDH
jgi:hypothetical protein